MLVTGNAIGPGKQTWPEDPVMKTSLQGGVIDASPLHAPVVYAIWDKAVKAGTTLSLVVGGFDPDGDVLTFSAGALPAGAIFAPQARRFDFTPASSQQGVHQVTFSVSEGAHQDSETISITVGP